MPGYSPHPPGPPSGTGRRGWPVLVAAGVAGAIIASLAAAVITINTRDTPATSAAPTPVTVTVGAPTPAPPGPLPTAKADRQTCQVGFIGTQAPTKSAADALSILPSGVKVLDPAVQANPQWSAAVQSAGRFYEQASDALESQIAPGTSPVLAQAAHTAVDAFRLVGNAYENFDPIAGNAYEIALSASDQMVALCTRLAP
jgi:hypothetical protein